MIDNQSIMDRMIWNRQIDNQIIIMTWLLSPIFFVAIYFSEGIKADLLFIPIILGLNGFCKLIWRWLA